MVMEVISILAGFVIMCAFYANGAGVGICARFLDVPSFLCILVLTVPVLLRRGLFRDFARAFRLLKKDYNCHLSELRRTLEVVELVQKQVLYAGMFSTLVSLICVFCMLDTPERLGYSVTVAILTVFYAVILEMLLLPLQIEAKRRIIDYMAEDMDTDADAAAQCDSGKLSEREMEVAWLCCCGYSNRQIGEELYIAESTVKKHVFHIYEKLGVASRKELKEMLREDDAREKTL